MDHGNQPDDSKTCPLCAETIKAAAVRCRFCGADLATGQAPRPSEQLAKEARQAAPPQVVQVEVKRVGVMRTVVNVILILTLLILASIVGTCVVCAKATHDAAEELNATSAGEATVAPSSDDWPAVKVTGKELARQMEMGAKAVCACQTSLCAAENLQKLNSAATRYELTTKPTASEAARSAKAAQRAAECAAATSRAGR